MVVIGGEVLRQVLGDPVKFLEEVIERWATKEPGRFFSGQGWSLDARGGGFHAGDFALEQAGRQCRSWRDRLSAGNAKVAVGPAKGKAEITAMEGAEKDESSGNIKS